MTRHKTHRGREFNMQAFANANGDSVAVGNVPRNARGDIIGPGGKVVATAQEVTAVYYKNNPKAVAKVSIKEDRDPQDQVLDPSEKVVKKRKFKDEDGNKKIEVTYEDGSIEVKDPEDAGS